MRIVPVQPHQYSAAQDINNIGLFGQEAVDALVKDAIEANRGWAGFGVTKHTTTVARVVIGRMYRAGVFYGNPNLPQDDIDLVTRLPAAARKIVAIIAFGTLEDTAIEPRSFKNQTTGLKEPQNVATQKLRQVHVDVVEGAESATPARPTVDPNYVPIAYVTLTTSGIENIALAEEFRLPNLAVVNGKVKVLDEFRVSVGSRLDTLATDLGGVKASIKDVNPGGIAQLFRAMAEVEDRLGLDREAALWGFDRFLTDAESDAAQTGYNARIEEGLCFPWAATREEQLALQNPSDPFVRQNGTWTLPRYSEVKRLNVDGITDISVNLASYQYANTSFTIYPGARRRRRWGTSQVVSSQSHFWYEAQYRFNYLTGVLARDDETWAVTDEWTEGGVTYYRLRQFWDDKINYFTGAPYPSTETASGYALGQTFLNAQAGWLLKLNVRFRYVVANHAIKVFVCEAPNGEPDPSKIVSRGTIAAGVAVGNEADGADFTDNRTPCVLEPAFLEAGKRYGLILVSEGDFAIACRTNNALTNGSLFFSDGNVFVPDIGKDMIFDIVFAEFDNPYVVVPLNTVTLSGGTTDIDVLSDELAPEGTELYFEVQAPNGRWNRLAEVSGTHLLAAKPETLPVRMVMVGTREAMPAIKLATSTVTFKRLGASLVHVSDELDAGTAVDTVRIELRLDAFDDSVHDVAVEILSGSNTDTPTTTVDQVLPDGVLRVMEFDLTAASQTYRIKITGSLTSEVVPYRVAYRYNNARSSV